MVTVLMIVMVTMTIMTTTMTTMIDPVEELRHIYWEQMIWTGTQMIQLPRYEFLPWLGFELQTVKNSDHYTISPHLSD